MKNIRMLLLVLAPLIIMTQVPVSVHAMASDSSETAKNFKTIEVLCYEAFSNADEAKRRLAAEKLLKLLPEPWTSFEWLISNERKQQELEIATLIKKTQIIERMAAYPFVNEAVLTRLIRYIEKKYPDELQGIINNALLSAASVGNFMLMRGLITNYGVDINFQQEGLTIHELLLVKDRQEFLRNNQDFRYVLVRVIPGADFNDYIMELITQNNYEDVIELIKDFITVRFDAEVATIDQLFQDIYELLRKQNPEMLKLLPAMLSAEQFIKLMQAYLDRDEYQMVFFIFKDLVASGSIKQSARVMELLGKNPSYQSDILLRHYIQKIIQMSREGVGYKDIELLTNEFLDAKQRQMEEEQRLKDEEFERQQQEFIRKQEVEFRERQAQIDSLLTVFTPKKVFVDETVARLSAILYNKVMSNEMSSVHKYLKDYASSKPDLVRGVFQYQGDDGLTLLHLLAMKVSSNIQNECWNILFSLGFNINIQDAMGNTLLHAAVMFKNNELYARLIAGGADPSIRNKAKQTPLDILKFTKGKKSKK